MPETPTQTARRRQQERRSFTVRGAQDIARTQENLLRQGYVRGAEPAPPARQVGPRAEPEAYRPPSPVTSRDLGGAEDDPNVEITIGPNGEIVRRRRQ